jgi:hypothetical protein
MNVLATAPILAGILAKKHSPKPPPKPPVDFGSPPTFDPSTDFSSVVPIILVVSGVLLVGLIAYISYSMKQRRRAGFAQMAAQLHLAYSEQDPLGILGYPFTLLQRGDGQGVENVVHGTWQEVAVIAFDYWYYDESTNSKGSTSRSYHRFNCVIVPVDADCPRLTIQRETFMTALADALTFHDIQFESDGFNRDFNVTCEVPKFANDLVDARMMEWLMATGYDHAYEALGDWVLVAGPRIDPVALTTLLTVARGFVQHVPKVVSSLYPG